MALQLKKLVLLGDSITEGYGDERALGWAGRIAQQLNGKPDERWVASNLGSGGDTVLDGRYRLLPALANYPTHITLAFGTNDMSRMLWPDNIGTKIDLHYAKQVWLSLFDMITRQGVRLSVIAPLPVQEEKFPFIFKPFDAQDKGLMFTNADQLAYGRMLADICARQNVPLIDLFDDWRGRDLDELLCDGLHPSTVGYDLLAAQIYTRLNADNFFS